MKCKTVTIEQTPNGPICATCRKPVHPAVTDSGWRHTSKKYKPKAKDGEPIEQTELRCRRCKQVMPADQFGSTKNRRYVCPKCAGQEVRESAYRKRIRERGLTWFWQEIERQQALVNDMIRIATKWQADNPDSAGGRKA